MKDEYSIVGPIIFGPLITSGLVYLLSLVGQAILTALDFAVEIFPITYFIYLKRYRLPIVIIIGAMLSLLFVGSGYWIDFLDTVLTILKIKCKDLDWLGTDLAFIIAGLNIVYLTMIAGLCWIVTRRLVTNNL